MELRKGPSVPRTHWAHLDLYIRWKEYLQNIAVISHCPEACLNPLNGNALLSPRFQKPFFSFFGTF